MDASSPWPRFEPTPYRAEGGYSPGSSALLLIASLATGLVLGLVFGFVRRWFYLILVFPVLIGLAVGGVGYWAVRQGKVRSTVLSGVSGLLGGLFAMLTMHYMGYLDFENNVGPFTPEVRAQMRELLKKPLPNIVGPAADDKLGLAMLQDPAFRAMIGVKDFPSYVDFRAVVGVQISGSRNVGKQGGGLNLGYEGSYIYWLVEVLIVAGIAVFIQAQAAKQPFCNQCQNWKETRGLGMITRAEMAAMQSGELEALRSPPPATQNPQMVMVSASVCPHCGEAAPVDVKVEEITGVDNNNKPQTRELTHVTYPGEALPYLQAIFQPLPPAEPPIGPAPPQPPPVQPPAT